MSLNTRTIADVLVIFNTVLRYPKEPTPELCQAWKWALDDERVTDEEFQFAAKRYVKTAADFPTPADLLGLIKERRNYHASLPLIDLRTPTDAPALPQDSGVTIGEHRARKADLEAKLGEIPVARRPRSEPETSEQIEAKKAALAQQAAAIRAQQGELPEA